MNQGRVGAGEQTNASRLVSEKTDTLLAGAQFTHKVRPRTRAWPVPSRHRYRSVAMILSMFRSASAVMVTNGLTLVLPGISAPSMTYRPGWP